MSQQFYVADGSDVQGPFSGRQLREMAKLGQVQRETMVSVNGEKWIPAGRIRELEFGALVSPPPVVAPPAGLVRRPVVPPARPVSQSQPVSLQAMPPASSAVPPSLRAQEKTLNWDCSPDIATSESETVSNSLLAKFLNDEQNPKAVAKLLPRVEALLMQGESIDYIAVQKKPVATISPDCVVLTNKRFLFFKFQLLGQVKFEDYIWRELQDARIEEGLLGAKFSIRVMKGPTLSIDYLPKSQARSLYRYAQLMEEKCAEERRHRELEERRASAGGVTISGGTPFGGVAAAAAEDPLQVLSKLKQLLDAGLITAQEFDAKKTEILSRM